MRNKEADIEFDFPAAIKELASAKLQCPGDGVAGRGGSVEHSLYHCTRCDDTAFVTPFASLRIISHSHSCPEYGRAVKYNHEPNKICTGYRTEPDVRVVCWEVLQWLARHHYILQVTESGLWVMSDARTNVRVAEADTAEEAVIRAAQAWLKGQHDLLQLQ